MAVREGLPASGEPCRLHGPESSVRISGGGMSQPCRAEVAQRQQVRDFPGEPGPAPLPARVGLSAQ